MISEWFFVYMQIVITSDVFSTSGQFVWMLGTFMEQIGSCSQEDVPSYALLVYGVLKCAAVERTVSCTSHLGISGGRLCC